MSVIAACSHCTLCDCTSLCVVAAGSHLGKVKRKGVQREADEREGEGVKGTYFLAELLLQF